MLKPSLFILAFCGVFFSYAQEELMTLQNNAKTSSSDIREFVSVVNTENDEFSVFFMDSKMVYGKLLDANFEEKKHLSNQFKYKSFDRLLGNSIDENNDYRLYFSNEKYSKFSTVNFSYAADTVITKALDLELNNERFVETINHENTFKILTISEKEPTLNIYAFDKDANYKKHQLDFSKDTLTNAKNKVSSLNKLLEELVKIEDNSLTAIDVSSQASKLYVRGNELVLSFDHNKDSTQVIAIDLEGYQKLLRKLPKPFQEEDSKQKKTNSYIHQEYLFTIAATKKKFTFAVQDLKTGLMINSYAMTSEDSITFKNSPIIQIGAVYDNYRELEKTKKFLQKINYGDVGISVHKRNDKYEIFLGGQHEYRATTGGMGMIKTPKGIQLFPGDIERQHFNPTLQAFNIYSNTKSTYIKSLVDTEFKHQLGNIKNNVFDKVKDFETNRESDKHLKTLFKYKDHFILGDYDLETNKLTLRKFKN